MKPGQIDVHRQLCTFTGISRNFYKPISRSCTSVNSQIMKFLTGWGLVTRHICDWLQKSNTGQALIIVRVCCIPVKL